MRIVTVYRLALAAAALAVGGAAAPAQEAQWKAFTDAGWRMSRAGDVAGAREYLVKALKSAEGFPADDPRRALTLSYLALVAQRQGQKENARIYAKQALAIYDPLPADGSVEGLGKGLNALALAHQGLKDYATAERLYEKASAAEEAARGDRSPVLAQFLGNRAALLEAQGRYEEAEPLRKRQLAILDTIDDPHNAAPAAAAHQQTGHLYRLWGKDARAESHLVRAVELRRRVKKDGPELAEAVSELGCLYFDLGKYDKAEPPLREAVLLRDVSGKASATREQQAAMAESLHNAGALYQAIQRYDAAETLLDRALVLRRTLAPDGDLHTAATLHSLGTLHLAQKKSAQAVGELGRALHMRQQALGENHLAVAAEAEALATAYVRLGNAKEAEKYFLRALSIREKALGTQHRSVAATLHNIANFYRDQRRYAEAEAVYRRALAAKEKALGHDSPALAGLLDNYALLLRQMRRTDEAAKLMKRAEALRAKGGNTSS